MGKIWFRLLDEWLISMQWSFENTLKRAQTINVNANFNGAVTSMVNALAGLNLFETVSEGELISA